MVRHHESMLADPRCALPQVTELGWHRYVPVAVVCNRAYTPNFPDGHVCQRVAMSEHSFVVGPAKALRLVRAIASSHGAGGACFTQWRVESQRAASEQSLVVTVTEAFGIDLLLTVVDLALAPLPQRLGWTRTSSPQHPPIVHLAIAACCGSGIASFYPAFRPHERNVSAATDRSLCASRKAADACCL